MPPASHGLRFAHETFGVRGIVAIARIDQFDGDGAVQLHILPVIHQRHAAAPDETLDSEVRQLAADEWIVDHVQSVWLASVMCCKPLI